MTRKVCGMEHASMAKPRAAMPMVCMARGSVALPFACLYTSGVGQKRLRNVILKLRPGSCSGLKTPNG
jgi:hypothetical protein